MSGFKKRLIRRLNSSEHGQSILLLAIGFIALAAFVGLVTDISIMFVRFATLRRAVDSAAVAAAGQVREGTDYATVALAARQYIVLHGLEPHRVWVETCETDIAEWRKSNPEPGVLPPDYNIADDMPETELCDWDNPKKLVRVIAQIDSETTFLRLLGIENFVLTSSSVSETASLDVVLVLDTSASMANGTRSFHYTNSPTDLAVPGLGLGAGAAGVKPHFNNTTMPGYCTYQLSDPANSDNWGWGGCCNDPGASAYVYLDKTTGVWKIYTDGVVTGGSLLSPPVARHTYFGDYARLALYNGHLYKGESYSVSGANGVYDAGVDALGVKYPTPDGNFSDLVCQPFRQVKDAARNFISQLDFIRGDRVALVGFDRLATIYHPNGDTDQPPMMVSKVDAVRTLDEYIGIYINPIGLVRGCSAFNMAREDLKFRVANINPATGAPITDPNDPYSNKIQNTVQGDEPRFHWNVLPDSYAQYAQCTTTNVGDGIKTAAGVLTNQDTIRRDSVWVAIILSDGAANSSWNIAPEKAGDTAMLWGTPPASNSSVLYGDFGFCPWYTFCYYREAGQANWDSVYWRDHPSELNPGYIDNDEIFLNWANGPYSDEADAPTTALTLWKGAFTNTNLKFRVSYNSKCLGSINRLGDTAAYRGVVDWCNDNIANTRHFCLQWSKDDRFNGIPEGMTYDKTAVPPQPSVTGTLQGECAENGHYDADDYARDMADFAGLLEVAPGVNGNFIAMFAIGFGEDFDDDPTAVPLMRYIADAGDNGRIDNTLQQDWRDNRQLDGGSFQGKDPCEGPEFDADRTKWCGQFYYAENIQELDAVFEAIASRLFTRISR